METVVVVGASSKETRYSYKAIKMLVEKGYKTIPVSIKGEDILGQKGFKNISDISCKVDIVTNYISLNNQFGIIEEIKEKKPKKVIFNPGAENRAVYKSLKDLNIEVIEACSLVLLETGKF